MTLIVPRVYRFTTNQPYFPSLSPSCFCFLSLFLSFPPPVLVFRFVSVWTARRTKRGIGCVNFYGLTFHRRRIKKRFVAGAGSIREISCPSLILVPLCRSSDGEISFFPLPFPSLFFSRVFRVHARREVFFNWQREKEKDAFCNVEFDTRVREKNMGYKRGASNCFHWNF